MRRIGLAVALIASILLPHSAKSQQAAKMYRIVVLANESSTAIDGLRHRLGDLGYLEGRDFRLNYAWAGTNSERFPTLAADVVRENPDFIVTWETPAALAAKSATTTIPIVTGAIGDPISTGVVTSLAHPGGNITGLSSLAVELEAKRLELLKSLAPQISRVAVLWNADNPALKGSSLTAIAAAQKLEMKLSFVSTTEEPTLEAVLGRIGRQRPDGLLVMAEPSLIAQGGKLTRLVSRRSAKAA